MAPVANGFLIPPWYHDMRTTAGASSNDVSSAIWGFSLGCALFSLGKMIRQTVLAYRRHRLFNIYIGLIWATWTATTSLSFIQWLYLQNILPASFWTFLATSIIWIVQIQCILQIVANRLSFMTFNRSRKLRLAVFCIMTFITVTGSCTWVPGSLQLSPTIVFVGSLWDRCNKAVFSAVDLGLNVTFLRMVWCKLVSTGLTKYKSLFRLNTCMVFLSISLDIILIGIESSPDDGVHLQYLIFNPMVFSVKLYIELNLAEMIAYIARSANPLCHGGGGATAVEERASLDRYADAAMIVDHHGRPDRRCRSSSETALARHAQAPPVALHAVDPWADGLRPEPAPRMDGPAFGRPSNAISPQCRE